MDAKPEGFYSTEWAGELISMMKQANEAGFFEKIKHVMLPVGAAMDVLEGVGTEMPENIWISGRYFFRYPNSARNNQFVANFKKRWNHYPAYVSETGYSALYAFKKAVELAGSKDTKAVVQALEGMTLDCPPGTASSARRTTRPCTGPLGSDQERSKVPVQDHEGDDGGAARAVLRTAAVRGSRSAVRVLT